MSTPNKRERESDDDPCRDVAPRLQENEILCKTSKNNACLYLAKEVCERSAL